MYYLIVYLTVPQVKNIRGHEKIVQHRARHNTIIVPRKLLAYGLYLDDHAFLRISPTATMLVADKRTISARATTELVAKQPNSFPQVAGGSIVSWL
jgi:hypothetical protein